MKVDRSLTHSALPCLGIWLALLVPLGAIGDRAGAASRDTGPSLSCLFFVLEPASEQKPLTVAEARQRFPRLIFANPDAEFEQLGVGRQEYLLTQLNTFAEKHLPHLPIKVRFVSWSSANTDLRALSKQADVIQLPSTWAPSLIEEDVLQPWGGLDGRDYVSPNVLTTCGPQGGDSYFAVPWIVDLRVLYYRPELTQNASPLETFQGLKACLSAARQVARADASAPRARLAVSLSTSWELLHSTFAPFVGGRLARQDETGRWRFLLNEGPARDGLAKLRSLVDEGFVHVYESPDLDREPECLGLARALIDGKCLAVVGSPHMRSVFDEHNGLDIRAVPIPRMTDRAQQDFLGGSHLAVTAGASKRGNDKHARALIRWLTGEDAAKAMYRTTGALPARRDAFEQFLKDHPRWAAFGESLRRAKPYPATTWWKDAVEEAVVRDDLHNVLRSMAQGQDWGTITQQLDAANQRLEEKAASFARLDTGVPTSGAAAEEGPGKTVPAAPGPPYVAYILIGAAIALIAAAWVWFHVRKQAAHVDEKAAKINGWASETARTTVEVREAAVGVREVAVGAREMLAEAEARAATGGKTADMRAEETEAEVMKHDTGTTRNGVGAKAKGGRTGTSRGRSVMEVMAEVWNLYKSGKEFPGFHHMGCSSSTAHKAVGRLRAEKEELKDPEELARFNTWTNKTEDDRRDMSEPLAVDDGVSCDELRQNIATWYGHLRDVRMCGPTGAMDSVMKAVKRKPNSKDTLEYLGRIEGFLKSACSLCGEILEAVGGRESGTTEKDRADRMDEARRRVREILDAHPTKDGPSASDGEGLWERRLRLLSQLVVEQIPSPGNLSGTSGKQGAERDA